MLLTGVEELLPPVKSPPLSSIVFGEFTDQLLLLPEVSSIRKLDMVTWGAGVGGRGSLLPLELKSNKEVTASKSTSSSSSSCPVRCLTDLRKVETE